MDSDVRIADSPKLDLELLPLLRLLERADGFALALLRCNVPVERERLATELNAALVARGRKSRLLKLESEVTDLESRIAELTPPLGSQEVILIVGFESSIPAASAAPALHYLNMARESFRRLPGPMVLILPDYALTRLAREAPDFWAWRSGVFEIAVAPDRLEQWYRSLLDAEGEIDNLPSRLKGQRAAVLEELYEEYSRSGSRHLKERSQIASELGKVLEDLGKWAQAFHWLEIALEGFELADDQVGRAQVTFRMGLLLRKQGRLAEARELFQQDLHLVLKLGDLSGQAAVLNQLGHVHHELGPTTEAATDWGRALSIFESLGDLRGQIRVMTSLGDLALEQNDFAKASKSYSASAQLSSSLTDPHSRATALIQLGALAVTLGQTEQAIIHFQEALSLNISIGNRRGEAAVLFFLGQAEIDRGAVEQAIQWLNRSIEIQEELGDRSSAAAGHSVLATIQLTHGDPVGARLNHQKALMAYELAGNARFAAVTRWLLRNLPPG